jgi:ATP-binding cassette, subfamily B, heavy metal transporter
MARRPSRLPASEEPAAPPDWRVLRALVPHLLEFPGRVLLAALCLIAAKLAGVALPMVMKYLVDALDAGRQSLLTVPLALLLLYGALRFASVLFAELRDVVFGRVAERAAWRSGYLPICTGWIWIFTSPAAPAGCHAISSVAWPG